MDEINLNGTGVTQAGVEQSAKHLCVRQWDLPQEWEHKAQVPEGQTIYGVSSVQ